MKDKELDISYFLSASDNMESSINRMSQIHTREHHVTIIEAMRRFYHSDTYKRLADEGTKPWHYADHR